MGTLFNQPPRDFRYTSLKDVKDRVEELQKIGKELKCDLKDVIAAADNLERQRRNDLYTSNGDAWDEQIGGIGDILKNLVDAIRTIEEFGLLIKTSEE